MKILNLIFIASLPSIIENASKLRTALTIFPNDSAELSSVHIKMLSSETRQRFGY